MNVPLAGVKTAARWGDPPPVKPMDGADRGQKGSAQIINGRDG
jgi:hypothetical protein